MPTKHSFPESLAPPHAKPRRISIAPRMCDVLQLQPAGAFLRQAYNLQPSVRPHSNPIAVVGSCNDIDEALQLRPADDEDAADSRMDMPSQQDEPEDFLSAIRRGIDELASEDSDEDDSDDESDDEGYYYQASKENTFYSPDQKLPGGFLQEDCPDLSDTSTASSCQLAPWTHHESEDEEDTDDLIFQLEM